MTRLCLCSLLAALIALAACSEQDGPAPQAPRVVRTLTLAAAPLAHAQEFSGEVKARHESRLAFRVGGKIIERLVDVGATVRVGQPLARLDASDLALALRAADARLEAAVSAFNAALANFQRFTRLREKNFISEAELERHRNTLNAAQAALESARSEAALLRLQLDYTTLKAPASGVITALDAEAGQVVAAGLPVMMISREGEREIAIFIPENKLDALRAASALRVSLWAAPGREWPGRVREISPSADPLTRTFAARVSVAGGEALPLGSTATVKLVDPQTDARLRLPLSALLQAGEGHAVWRVDQGSVHRTPVTVGATVGNEVEIASGLRPGQVVVTAGVHLLHEGQRVRPQAGS